MATLILIIAILAGYHYFMESVVLPSFRFKVKCNLLALRDRLAVLKINHTEDISEKTFTGLNVFVTIMANNLPYLNIVDFIQQSKKIRKNNESDQIVKEFENHKLPEIKQIFEETSKNAAKALFINSASWMIYLLPFIIIIVLFSLVFHGISRIKSLIFYSKDTQKTMMLIAEQNQYCNDETTAGYYNVFNKKSNAQILDMRV